MKKRVFIVFSLLPGILGFLVASMQGGALVAQKASIDTHVIPTTDRIILSNNGDIYELSQNTITQMTHGQHLIEPIAVGHNIVAVEKTTNYASLYMFDQNGNRIKTLFNGNSTTIDTMSWISDPAVNAAQNRIAYVSDKDKAQTHVPDNALYVLHVENGESTPIVKPDPYSGGLTDPVFDPVNMNIILYDYYQYDPQTLIPYSTIEQYNSTSSQITTVTFENKNAYQQAISPDGKHLLFLGRNDGSSTATLYVADFDSNKGLSNMHALLTSDLAYPEFSNTKGVIYYLQAQGNRGYNLMKADIWHNTLRNIQSVVTGNTLLGNSSYQVIR